MRNYEFRQHHKRKRIRKKYKLKEFAVYGVEIKFDTPMSENDKLIDDFISFLESIDCYCGGGIIAFACDLTIGSNKGTLADAKIDVITKWLKDNECAILECNKIDMYREY